MNKAKSFTDLKVWSDAHKLTIELYGITKNFSKSDWSLISQIRRAASSVGANIAEGFGRYHYKEKIKFYLNARGSALELENHILLSRDLKYINKDISIKLLDAIKEISKELNGLIKSTGSNSGISDV